MKIDLTFTWGEYNVTPPRCRKPRTVDRTDSHTVEVPSVTAAQAPIALRIPERVNVWGTPQDAIDYRWFDGTLYRPAMENVYGREPEQLVAGSREFPFEVDRTGDAWQHKFGIRSGADSLDDMLAEIDSWWAKYIVIDGLVWEKAYEPRYTLRTWRPDRYTSERRVTAEIALDGGDIRDSHEARVYAASDLDTLLADGRGAARNGFRAAFTEDFTRIEVLIPETVTVKTTHYYEAMSENKMRALRDLLTLEHVRPEDADQMSRRVVDSLVEREGFAAAQGALRSWYGEHEEPSDALRGAMVAAGVAVGDQPNIARTTFTFTVLHPADVTFDDLRTALDEAFDGHAVGQETNQETVLLGDTLVPGELVRLGNDGTFFDSELQHS